MSNMTPAKSCVICSKVFSKRGKDTYAKWDSRKYCSQTCYQPTQTSKTVSSHTRSLISLGGIGRKPTLVTRKKLSDSKLGEKNPSKRIEVREKISKTLTGRVYPERRGVNSKFWRGGTSDLRSMVYSSPQYKKWRSDILERDDYTCQLCYVRNSKGLDKSVRLNVDHFPVPFFRFIDQAIRKAGEEKTSQFEYLMNLEQAWDINNGRVLCEECHRKTPTWGRAKKSEYGTDLMSIPQEAHLFDIKESFSDLIDPKYRNGQIEHGGNLWDMPLENLIDCAIEEVLDQFVYISTLKAQLDTACRQSYDDGYKQATKDLSNES